MKMVYGVDDRYFIGALLSVHSFQQHNERLPISIYMDRVEDRHWQLAHDVDPHIELIQYQPPYNCSETPLKFPSMALLPVFLPTLENEHLLVIDADTLVMDDVTDLLTSISAHPLQAANCIWAVAKARQLRMHTHISEESRIRIGKTEMEIARHIYDDYFNSGVMLMDCSRIDSIPHHADEELWLPDQNILNRWTKGLHGQFHIRFNQQASIPAQTYIWSSDRMKREIQEAIEKPGIFHYADGYRPWLDHHPEFLRMSSTKYYFEAYQQFHRRYLT